MATNADRAAGLKYTVEMLGAGALYVAVLFARGSLLHLSGDAAWQAAVKLSPALPIWLMFLAVIRQYRRSDEYMKLLLLRIVAVCAGIAACLTSSYPFWRDAFGGPEISIMWAWPVMGACWAVVSSHLDCPRHPRCAPPSRSMKNRLKELRAEQGLTQAELAAKLDVSRQTVIAIETGRYDPSLPLAFAIAKAFGRRIEDIFQPEN